MIRKLAPLLLIAALVACGDDDDVGDAGDVAEFTYREHVVKVDDAVTVWGRAGTIEEAHAAAEAAANLVVGSGGPAYGDRDGNGNVDGEAEFGVLPGVDGSPVGLADALSDNECVAADVLGGAWDDPAGRWAALDVAVAGWSADDNTMQSLASHPMRVVGWASLALGTDALDDAQEFASRAEVDVEVSLDALDC